MVLGPTKKIFFRREMQIVAIIQHTHTHNTSTSSCLLPLNKSRPSPASRPPRFRCETQRARFFCFLTSSSSSFFGFVASARDLDGSASRAMMSGDFCVSIIQREFQNGLFRAGKRSPKRFGSRRKKNEKRNASRKPSTFRPSNAARGRYHRSKTR